MRFEGWLDILITHRIQRPLMVKVLEYNIEAMTSSVHTTTLVFANTEK